MQGLHFQYDLSVSPSMLFCKNALNAWAGGGWPDICMLHLVSCLKFFRPNSIMPHQAQQCNLFTVASVSIFHVSQWPSFRLQLSQSQLPVRCLRGSCRAIVRVCGTLQQSWCFQVYRLHTDDFASLDYKPNLYEVMIFQNVSASLTHTMPFTLHIDILSRLDPGPGPAHCKIRWSQLSDSHKSVVATFSSRTWTARTQNGIAPGECQELYIFQLTCLHPACQPIVSYLLQPDQTHPAYRTISIQLMHSETAIKISRLDTFVCSD